MASIEVDDSNLGQRISLPAIGRGGQPVSGLVVPGGGGGASETWGYYAVDILPVYYITNPTPGLDDWYYEIVRNVSGLFLLTARGRVEFELPGGSNTGALSFSLPFGLTRLGPVTGRITGRTNGPVTGYFDNGAGTPSSVVGEFWFFDSAAAGVAHAEFSVEVAGVSP